MKKTLDNIAIAVIVLPLISILLYALFDVTLWASIESEEKFRPLLLVVLHVASLVAGAMLLLDEEVSNYFINFNKGKDNV